MTSAAIASLSMLRLLCMLACCPWTASCKDAFACTEDTGVALCDDEELAREPWFPDTLSRLEILDAGVVATCARVDL